MTTGALASHIYNDTGFRLHQKKDYAGSRDLFLKAAWADPRAPLPPYNLACAYALLGDEANAEKALDLAIAVGGDKVKARAKKDSDFAKVTGAKWFQALTG
jgi:Flp pilus assembly protein TadD